MTGLVCFVVPPNLHPPLFLFTGEVDGVNTGSSVVRVFD